MKLNYFYQIGRVKYWGTLTLALVSEEVSSLKM